MWRIPLPPKDQSKLLGKASTSKSRGGLVNVPLTSISISPLRDKGETAILYTLARLQLCSHLLLCFAQKLQSIMRHACAQLNTKTTAWENKTAKIFVIMTWDLKNTHKTSVVTTNVNFRVLKICQLCNCTARLNSKLCFSVTGNSFVIPLPFSR